MYLRVSCIPTSELAISRKDLAFSTSMESEFDSLGPPKRLSTRCTAVKRVLNALATFSIRRRERN